MPRTKATPDQLSGLLLLSLFTLGAETLPDRLSAAGGAAWLCPLLVGGGIWAGARLLTRGPLAGRRLLGDRPGDRLLAGLLLLWGLPVTAAQALRVGLRLSEDLRGSPLLLTAALVILAAWMAGGGLAALGRAGRLFTLAVGLTFGVIVLFGLPGLRWDWILLWDSKAPVSVPRGCLTVLETLSPGAYALLLLEDLEERGAASGPAGRLAALCPLLAVGTLLVAGRLGPGLAARVEQPFFQMVSGLGFQGAFQRLEELVSALWLLGDLTMLAVLLLCLGRLLAGAGRRREGSAPVWPLAALVLALAAGRSIWAGQEQILEAGTLGAGALLAGLTAAGKNSEKTKKGA